MVSEKDATVLKLKKGKKVTTLDSIAFDDKSYREIFEQLSATKDNFGFENGTYAPFAKNTINPSVVEPSIDTTNPYSGTYCVKTPNTASSTISLDFGSAQVGDSYWCAGKFNCTYRTSGMYGFMSGEGGYTPGTQGSIGGNTVTNEYVTIAGKITIPSGTSQPCVWLGASNSAKITVYYDDVIIVRATAFTTQPTEDQWKNAYETYLALLAAGGEIEEDIYETLIEVKTGFPELECSDQDAYNLFISEMNKYATKIGMTQTTYYDAAGYKAGTQTQNKSRTRDLVKLGYKGMAYPQLVEIWNCPSKTVKSSGTVGTWDLVSTVVDHDGMADVLKTNYYLLGGKTGSIEGMSGGNRFLYVMTLQHKTTGHVITTATITSSADTASKNRFKACRCLADIAIKLIEADEYGITNSDNISDATVKSEVKTLETEFSSYNGLAGTVFVTPKYPAAMDYALYFGGDGNKQFVYDTNGEAITYCASTTKIMNALMVLKWIPDLHETITLKASDISAGTGPVFQGGETFTYEDALYLLMLPSSNTMANAIARAVGHKMYNCFNRE